MRVIRPATVRSFERDHPDAAAGLRHWLEVTRTAAWTRLHDVRLAFRSADGVRVESGRTVVIFNIAGNRFRLVTAIHYNRGKVFVLRFMSHAEYSKNRWKDEL